MGISIVSSRRLPESLSNRPMHHRGWISIMARNRLDRRDHFVVADVLAGAQKRRVPAVHQDREIVLRVAAQGVNQLLAFFGDNRSKVHGIAPFLGTYDATDKGDSQTLAADSF